MDLTPATLLSYKNLDFDTQGRNIYMQIHSLQPTSAVQSANRPNATKAASPVQSTTSASALPTDQLDLSTEAQQIGQNQSVTANSDGIRTEKVAALRQAIASGAYETPEKLSSALDKMLDTFA
jgi:flagellar biosynthesis anti-sigma factor FlgM